jgi:DNA-binding NtrC family response regulator
VALEGEIFVCCRDIVLPGVSGLEMPERARKRHRELPVVILTDHASPQNVIVALKLGAFDFIVKGLDRALAVLVVRRAARQRRENTRRRAEIAAQDARVAEVEGQKANAL